MLNIRGQTKCNAPRNEVFMTRIIGKKNVLPCHVKGKMIGTRFIVKFALLINSMHKENLDTSLVRHVKLANHVVGH